MNVKKILLAYSLLVFYTICPMLLYTVEEGIRERNGCLANDSIPCVIGGVDWHTALHWMGLLGYLIILTLPTGLAALLIYTVKLLVRWVSYKKSLR